MDGLDNNMVTINMKLDMLFTTSLVSINNLFCLYQMDFWFGHWQQIVTAFQGALEGAANNLNGATWTYIYNILDSTSNLSIVSELI